MKKEEIYVVIDDEPKRLRAIQILTDAKEVIFKYSDLLTEKPLYKNLEIHHGEWLLSGDIVSSDDKTEITLYQLEQLLNPKQEEPIKLDALKLIAESYGFELVEKKREPKVGDFGKFWDDLSEFFQYGFLTEIEGGSFVVDKYHSWDNFAHLTDEEKKQIQENL